MKHSERYIRRTGKFPPLGKHLVITADSLEQAVAGGQGATPRQVVAGWAMLLDKAEIRIREIRVVEASA